jgi:hypothetical protein
MGVGKRPNLWIHQPNGWYIGITPSTVVSPFLPVENGLRLGQGGYRKCETQPGHRVTPLCPIPRPNCWTRCGRLFRERFPFLSPPWTRARTAPFRQWVAPVPLGPAGTVRSSPRCLLRRQAGPSGTRSTHDGLSGIQRTDVRCYGGWRRSRWDRREPLGPPDLPAAQASGSQRASGGQFLHMTSHTPVILLTVSIVRTDPSPDLERAGQGSRNLSAMSAGRVDWSSGCASTKRVMSSRSFRRLLGLRLLSRQARIFPCNVSVRHATGIRMP